MIYYVVFMNDRAISLVRLCDKQAILIAGNDVSTGFFPDGRPNTETDLPVCYQPIASAPSHPSIGEWIGRLQNRVRKKQKSLTQTEVIEVKRLKDNKVRLRVLADRFGVSLSTVKRV